jgi:hypothetical protein
MNPDMIYGLGTGLLFGFLLQRGRVIRYGKQLGALRFQDFTIFKFMLSSIVVAMVGTYYLYDLGMVKLSIKPMIVGGVVGGGILFGIGWALLGYCPGTSVAAVAEGRLDALWGIAGGLVGAGLYAEAFPLMSNTLLKMGDFGRITIPQVLGVSHWYVAAGVILVTLLFFLWAEKKGL